MNVYGLDWTARQFRGKDGQDDFEKQLIALRMSKGSQAELRSRRHQHVTDAVSQTSPAVRNWRRNQRQEAARGAAALIGNAGRKSARIENWIQQRARTLSRLDRADVFRHFGHTRAGRLTFASAAIERRFGESLIARDIEAAT